MASNMFRVEGRNASEMKREIGPTTLRNLAQVSVKHVVDAVS